MNARVMQPYLLIFGLGYCGAAIGAAAVARGWTVGGTLRDATRAPPAGITRVAVDAALDRATHLLMTAPPDGDGDPLLTQHSAAIAQAANLRWIGYLSTTGVYGDRGGGWVDEASLPAPGSERTRRRVAAEGAWARFADRRAVDIFRLAGIYGPGRSAFDDLRASTARRVIKPGHAFGRIHRDDIVAAVRKKFPGANIELVKGNNPMPYPESRLSSDFSRAKEQLGYEPEFPIERAVEDYGVTLKKLENL